MKLIKRDEITVISFDLNDTLVDREYADYFWLELIPRAYAEKYKLGFNEAYSRVISEYNRVGPNDIKWYLPKYWIRHFDLDVSLEELIEETLSKVRIYPEVPEALRKLSERFTLIIASNTSIEFIDPVLEKIHVEVGYDVFDKVFSCVTDLGLPRKEESFYKYVCDALKVVPSEVLHVGDDLKYDYVIPRNIGMNACLVDRKGKLNSTPQITVIKDLRELVTLLQAT